MPALAEVDELANYEVAKGRCLVVRGKAHPAGQVMAASYADWDGGLAERVRAGHLIPTLKPRDVEEQPPAAKSLDDPAPRMAQEMNRMTAEMGVLRDLVKEHEKAVAEYKRSSDSKDRVLGQQVTEMDRLRQCLDLAQKRCEELTLEVEQVTIRATVAEAELAKVRATRPSTSGRKTADVKPPETPIVSGAAAGFVMTPAGVTSPAPPG